MAIAEPHVRNTLESLLASSPFQTLLGLRLEAFDVNAKSVTLRLVYGPNVERATGSGQYHGGVIASLIDVAGDLALAAALGFGVPTINFRVDYLRPARSTDLLALARLRKAGRSVGVVDVEVVDTDDQLIALGRGCYSTRTG